MGARTGVRFQLLGRVEAYRDGIELDLGPRKQRAVLALLLLNANRVVSTEGLIDDLWGDAPPSTARSALQVYVAGLRKALTDDGAALLTRSPGYVLELEPGAVDLERFSRLRAEAREADDAELRAQLLHEALDLWHDAPLADLQGEPFFAAELARLEELRLGALEERVDADLALGRHAALVSELDALVAAHPYRERLRAQLMLALYRSGRQADALDAYQAGRRVLQDELGLEPGTELRELEAAILRHDERLDPAPEAPTEPVPARPRRRRLWAGVALAVVAVLAAAIAALFALRGDDSPAGAPPNSVAVIDPKTNALVDVVEEVGDRPEPVAEGFDSVWVGNLDDLTLSRIDPETRKVVRRIPLGGAPTAVATGLGYVWVVHGQSGWITRVDPQTYETKSRRVTGASVYFTSAGVTTENGRVWAVYGDSTLARVDPVTLATKESTRAGEGPAGMVAYSNAIWVSNNGNSTVQRFVPTLLDQGPLQERGVPESPYGIAGGEGGVWVACRNDDRVTWVDAASKATVPIPVGDGPTAVAVGADGVWVANKDGRSVSRVDLTTREPVKTIELGAAPAGIAVADGLVWVAVQAP